MKIKSLMLLCVNLMIGGMLLGGSDAAAQTTRYQPPAGPTLSPYLNYLRRDVGVLDRYNAFVRPEINLRNAIQAQNSDLQYLNRQFSGIQRDVRDIQGRPTDAPINNQFQIRRPNATATGTGGRFFNYSHYYQMPTPRRR